MIKGKKKKVWDLISYTIFHLLKEKKKKKNNNQEFISWCQLVDLVNLFLENKIGTHSQE